MWSLVARVRDECLKSLPRASNVGTSHSTSNPIIKAAYATIAGMDNQPILGYPSKF